MRIAYGITNVRIDINDPEVMRKVKYSLGGFAMPEFTNLDFMDEVAIPWLMAGLADVKIGGADRESLFRYHMMINGFV